MAKSGRTQQKPSPAPRAAAGPDAGLTTLRKILARLDGSRLCFGEPVQAQGVTVIPVARVRAAGGAGFGRGDTLDGGDDTPGGGGGGGGYLEADPVGYVTVAQDGSTRYEAIPDPQAHARAARTLAAAAATLVAAFAGARALRGGGGPSRPRVGRRRPAALRRGD